MILLAEMLYWLKINVLPKLYTTTTKQWRLNMKTMIAVLNKGGENAVPTVLNVLEKVHTQKINCFGLATPSKIIKQNASIVTTSNTKSQIAVAYASNALGEPKLLSLEKATLVFDGRIYSTTPKALLSQFLAKKMKPSDLRKATSSFFKTEGDFSIILAQEDQILAARDPVGVQPLYYGENKSVVALASNRKALWILGINEPKSFPPGNLAVVKREGFKFEPVKTLSYGEPKVIGLTEAAEQLQELLQHSVRERVSGLKKVGVAFSGGLDSSLVAVLAKKCGVSVLLIHVSLENQTETDEALKAAEELQLPIQVHLYKQSDVEKIVPKVIELIEEPDPIKASIGVPFYWNSKEAAAAGYRVLLAGQGADELFGGYQRYVTEYIQFGNEKVRKTMFHDVAAIHESNIERDEKICDYHDVELRLPFASYPVAEFAMSLPSELKFEKNADSLRKLVLRKVAENLGVPEDITKKPKKAVQYGTGINNAIKKIAKKHNATIAEYIGGLFEEVNKKF